MAFIFLFTLCATAEERKLIEYGWDCPDPAYVRAHIAEMEKRPFDGVVIRCPKPAEPGTRGRSLGWLVFGKEELQPKDYEYLLPDLRAIPWNKFTDNFIQVIAKPGNVDWADDAGWQSICHNAGVMAKLARAGHCVGIMFDPEEYGKQPFWLAADLPPIRSGKATVHQYKQLAVQRGQQFMHAINKEFPNIQILCLFGPSLTHDFERVHRPNYALLEPFIQGMCQAADAGTQITDGCEQSYMYRTETAFKVMRDDIVASLKDPHFKVGFGLWIDSNSNKQPWQSKDFDLNYFQPNTWLNAVSYTLRNSDKYVWVYDEQLNWWTGEKVFYEYEIAQFLVRERPVFPSVPPVERKPNKFTPSAAGRNDDSCFADLLQTHDVIFDLPKTGWKLFNKSIEIGKYWNEQGVDYDGYATYSKVF